MEDILKFGAELLREFHQKQEKDTITKKIIKAELSTSEKLLEFQNKTHNLDTFASDFKKIQTEINTEIVSDIKNSFIKNKILHYLTQNTDKIYRDNLLQSQKEKFNILSSSISEQLIDLQKLAKYGTKNIEEIVQIADYSLSNIKNIVSQHQFKNIHEKAMKGIAQNYFEGLLSHNINIAKQFLSSDFATKYIKEGYLAEIQLKQQENINKITNEVIKNTHLKGLKDRIKLGYKVESQEIYALANYIDQKEMKILQEENDFMQKIRKMNKSELENLKKVEDKNRIPKIDQWILNLESQLKNNALKTADKLDIINLQDIDFNNESSIKKREEDVEIIKNHYGLDAFDAISPDERKKINEFLENSTSDDVFLFGKLLYRNGETILESVSQSLLQTIKYSSAPYSNAETNALKILDGEKIKRTLKESPFKDLNRGMDLVIGDSFVLNPDILYPLRQRIESYLIAELKTAYGGIFSRNKSFNIPDVTESDIRKAIKSITGSEIGYLNGNFFLTPCGYNQSDVKNYIKKLKAVKNTDGELGYWNNKTIYPSDILKKGNLKMIEKDKYIIFIRDTNKNSDYLRTKDGEYFVLSF